MKYGLEQNIIDQINAIFESHKEIEKIILYGSRAKANFRPNSDIDLTLIGEKINLKLLNDISWELDDLLLHYTFDLSIYNHIKQNDLLEHIERVGIVFYQKKSMSEWKEYRLGDVAEIVGGGTPKTKVSEYWNGDIPWLSVTDFNIGKKYVYNTEKSITALGLAKSSTKILKKGQIIISARGTVGVISMLGKDMAFNQSNYGIDAKNEITENHFLYYLLKNTVPLLLSNSYGAVFNTITKTTFDHIDINLPPLPEQKAIAEVLSSLDDKIDLLHRQNKTLEQMAETLFRQRFVKEAKEDWEERPLKDIYEFEKGFEPGSKNYLEEKEIGTIRFKRVGDMLNPNAGVYISKHLVKRECKKNDLIMSFDGTIGKITFGIEGAYSSGIRKIYSLNDIFNNLGLKFLIFSSKDIQDLIKSHSTGSVILHASSSINYLNFSFPSENLIKKFNQIINPIFNKILENKTQIRTLEKMRDTLLPKLMSGEIRINFNRINK